MYWLLRVRSLSLASLTLCCMTRRVTLVKTPHIHCVPRNLNLLRARSLPLASLKCQTFALSCSIGMRTGETKLLSGLFSASYTNRHSIFAVFGVYKAVMKPPLQLSSASLSELASLHASPDSTCCNMMSDSSSSCSWLVLSVGLLLLLLKSAFLPWRGSEQKQLVTRLRGQ
jgi:hypothetical protein